MAFILRPFGTRITPAEEIEPKRLIVISCEDESVQPAYFHKLKEVFEIHTLTEVTILPCINGRSAVEYVCQNLNDYVIQKSEQYGFDERDEFWIVIDRESPTHVCHKKLLSKLVKCKKFPSNFKIAVANPLFELWLLLHVDDLSKHDYTDLLNNEKVSLKKRFIDQKLSEHLDGYNKEKKKINKTMTKIVTKENVLKAIKREKKLQKTPSKIISNNKLGSNIGLLVESILND